MSGDDVPDIRGPASLPDEQAEHERVVSWLRWLNTANRNPDAHEALHQIMTSARRSTVVALADAIERMAHHRPRRWMSDAPEPDYTRAPWHPLNLNQARMLHRADAVSTPGDGLRIVGQERATANTLERRALIRIARPPGEKARVHITDAGRAFVQQALAATGHPLPEVRK